MNNAPIDSPEQAAVITAPENDDVLVVAGAGSGKTYTMTRRIVALIERGVAPERILGLTFTRKAAGELLSRVAGAVLGESVGEGEGESTDRLFLKPEVSTYDAFFQSIVRQYGLLVGFDQNTQPLSEAGALQLVTEVIDRNMGELRGQDLGAFSTLARQVLSLCDAIGSAMIGGDVTDMDQAIARVRAWDDAFINQVRTAIGSETVPEEAPTIGKPPRRTKKDTDDTWAAKLSEYREKLHNQCVFNCANLLAVAERRELLLNLVEQYATEKRRLNMAEFSDFTIAAYQLVTRFPSIGERYRKRFSHVLLDEYQDTSTTQAALLATLFAARGTAVGAVGDPFQSIYAWRGASPGAFRMFQQSFHLPADAKPYPLSVTRRNSKLVLEAANNLTLPLRQSPRRAGSSLMREVDVTALSALPEAPQGTVGVLGYDTLGQEVDGVVRFCREAIARNSAPESGHKGSVAVLFRSKTTMPAFQQALEQAGLTTMVVGYSAMLSRPEIRDILALLHVAADHTDSASLMRLLATPRFHLDANALTALASLAQRLNVEAQYRALVVAGLVSADADRKQWDALVREHRDEVVNSVFLPDVLMREDLEEQLGLQSALGKADRLTVLHAGRMLRQVCDATGRPLADVVRTAAEALDLDIDMVLAQAFNNAETPVNPTLARTPVNTVIDLVDTYTSEISLGTSPTLRGFMAWVDQLGSIEDETSTLNADSGTDVELMTVHQSKGLEWDAVAVVGLKAGAFPSNQGDHLAVKLDDNHPGGMQDGSWAAPEYRETARTWLADPAAVPVPVRADADILPRFPHDAPAQDDPIEALHALEDIELIDDEVYGSLRQCGDDVDEVDPDTWYLTQEEEYGRRLHADERRLVYVALTRARNDALLTYSRTSEPGRDPRVLPEKHREAAPSNFWLEVHDSLCSHSDVASNPSNLPAEEGEQPEIPLPSGYFAGERAQCYENAVVGEAWLADIETSEGETALAWPSHVSERVASRLASSADAVRRASCSDTESALGSGSLLDKARLLVADDDLMTGVLQGEALDEAVKAKAQRILESSRQSVTSLQAGAGGMSEREERGYWRSIIRPIPSVASPAASAGTQFHAWAERFFDAELNEQTRQSFSRKAMLGELAEQVEQAKQAENQAERQTQSQTESQSDSSDAQQMLAWKQRLAASPWAKRTPAWVERQIVVSIPELNGQVVNGKLDAVFVGGLDPNDNTKRFTIVDWKTGRRPRKSEDITRKLVQLDLYRLLLSAIEGVPLESIDTALYYVSEPDEQLRQLQAEPKTQQDIIAELSSGPPEPSDDD
ncbi:ATP-dependent DNA helicase [Bifidobacterium panos]|uniref:DNA 3'-5' helicase n=1 Tax=Bifidobacterium panos TaxID=2675321 RepID=A0ABX1SUX5_9BIFI|nr:ATP-dependent DNA helicase [Bifidobacterium sp. DSM 109963]NMN01624.1 ATP-dependent DNA helicase [Bifidobacterium sp. DSM 109963]